MERSRIIAITKRSIRQRRQPPALFLLFPSLLLTRPYRLRRLLMHALLPPLLILPHFLFPSLTITLPPLIPCPSVSISMSHPVRLDPHSACPYYTHIIITVINQTGLQHHCHSRSITQEEETTIVNNRTETKCEHSTTSIACSCHSSTSLSLSHCLHPLFIVLSPFPLWFFLHFHFSNVEYFSQCT